MKKFRLGLVGAGRMGLVHLRAAADSALVEIAAVADPSVAAREMLRPFGVAVHADAMAMIGAGGLDGVLIATPSPTHVATIAAVAARGLPILCEKPCGISAAQAKEAAAIAESAGVHLQIGYWRRFVPELKALRERIMAGSLGELYLVSCFQWDETPPPASFRASGGGAFIDMGVHEFDQLRWLTGQELQDYRVAAASTAFAEVVPEDPDAVQLLCTLSKGGNGLVSLGRRFPIGDACWVQAFGTMDFAESRFFWPPAGEAVFFAALRAQLEDFARAVQGQPSAAATAADAVAALVAAEAATAALRQAR
ncbi:Rhizopine catabolism protein MocA [Shinella sp. SUS2]|jgi:myo-inositol 2-dehydrogenase/D-chiro-inositol 1-dehydrogenase|uniref:Gfo/Idh/MocA family protein n=1 Tax=unclassified Shinella TaxID=2643062 RepID=UPI000429A94A|nr:MULTISPECIES: Gfo/Idh/MocA family oxidoreductase [unclassified Shinella]KNY15414.1 Rhizopine catabolism protein MocA [Shinella sp. SUS2]KOC74775.1 Rhizopine catabolism protein MocA [Shinella sp. GWS1]MCA0342745.1 Gfo/Idh/MocA family oxidoreductase [Pseudomonadota bacterium]MDG4674321.1 Gfo/Idh/MocA family oxidoreductase [Shinella sp. 838]